MIDPLNQNHVTMMDRLKRSRRAAFAVIMLERLSTALWRIFTWAGLFAGLWLLQIPNIFEQSGTVTAWFVFLGGIAWLCWRDIPSLRRPTTEEIDRRLEQAGSIAHRPLAMLDDKLSNPRQATTRILWSTNKEQALAAIRALRLPRPSPLLASRDPAALRIFVAIVVIVGVIVAGPQASMRLKQGLFPFHFGALDEAARQDVSIWITPPDYTGLKTIILGGGRVKDPVPVPAGSTIKVRVSKGWSTPKLTMGKQSLPFKQLEDGKWSLEAPVAQGTHLIIRQGLSKKADIAYDYKLDTPPIITVKGEPKTLQRGQWQFETTVKDDYGVTNLTLHMTLDPSVTDKPLGKPVKDTKPVLTPGNLEVKLNPVYDMTWHSWAGLPVIVTLEATDHLGQSSTTAPMKLKLPERMFQHPVAAALNGMRKRLAWTPEASASNIAFELEKIMSAPGAYRGDIVVFLSLRSAASRLFYDPTVPSAEAVIAQLWDTAVKVEDGNLPLAARDFQQAKEDLEKLLSDPKATPEQIAQAMEKLRTALGKYLQETMTEIQKRMAANGLKPLDNNQINNLLSPEDLQAFLDQLQSQALTGDKNAARDMLSQLGDLTNSLDPSMSTEVPKDLKFMADAMKEMQDILEKQEDLKKQTQGNEDNKEKSEQQQKEQQALIDRLESMMLKADEALGKIPENMQKADEEMRGAAEKLGQNKPGDAARKQQAAIDKLKEGKSDMAEQAKQRIKQMMAMAMGGAGLDPLGHRNGMNKGPGMFPNSNIKIPDQAERKRVQEIMKTLRQKSGDLSRPDYELDYYRRLMRQF